MGCWRELPQSESSLCERTAVAVVVDKLLFLQLREFSSSGNRTWSAPPDDENTGLLGIIQVMFLIKNIANHESMHALEIVLYAETWCSITVFLLGRKSFRMRKKFFPYCLRPLMKRFCGGKWGRGWWIQLKDIQFKTKGSSTDNVYLMMSDIIITMKY